MLFRSGEEDSYYGSESLKEAYETLYRLYEGQGFSGKEIEGLLVLDVKEQDWFSERGFGDQHAGGGAFAYEESIMGWLFGDHDIKKDPGRMDEMKIPTKSGKAFLALHCSIMTCRRHTGYLPLFLMS